MPRAAAKPEGIRADEAALILGVPLRTVQAMASRGDIPDAAKIGKVWTFSEAEGLRELLDAATEQAERDAAEIERLTAALATARNDALEEARLAAVSKSVTHDCDYRGIQDWETGEVPCSREKAGDACECSVKSELAFDIADTIGALKGGTK